MNIIKVQVPKLDKYNIIIAPKSIDNINTFLKDIESEQIFIITDKKVGLLYKNIVIKFLQKSNFVIHNFILEEGEKEKSLENVIHIIKALIKQKIQRRSIIMALGGGVVTDISGFVASIYMRGIKYVNIPTTLLSQVDAAIGGKTGVNLIDAKNIIGSFHHPSLVIIDPSLLITLSDFEIRQGLAEIIKIAIISSKKLFRLVQSNIYEIFQKKIDILEQVITESIRLQLNLLEPDPYENNLCRLLNFGHTIGHALESVIGYGRISHGDAISIGMITSTRLAKALGLCDIQTLQQIESILVNAKLPITFDRSVYPKLLKALESIKMIRGGRLNVVLPTEIGNAIVDINITANELCNFISVK